MLHLLFISYYLLGTILAGPSERGKFALECYSLCMRSGTSSAGSCNCPISRTPQKTTFIDKLLTKAEIFSPPQEITSEYLDSHTIKVQIPTYPGAFAYVFEYSTISTKPDEWLFAGASVNPSVTFSVLDSCRDYQIRAIIVLRATSPDEQLIIIRPTPIPVRLPPFTLQQNQISVEIPSKNATSENLRIFIKWSLPHGYSESDVYGYEAPALYPIYCHTPEDELPQPKVEIAKSGGRLCITLPSSVLDAKCRLWTEVRMLPRCIRLEPFSIQKNIEIDCGKTPDLEVCNKATNPQCNDIIDVTGHGGHVLIGWKPPNSTSTPVYYHVRYGPVQMKGIAPFISWQLATHKDVKVAGSMTSLAIQIPEDQDYGAQVCAIMTPHRKRTKFGLVRVTPFQCLSCKNNPSRLMGNCGDCSIVEGPMVQGRSWNKLASHESVKQNIHKTDTIPSSDRTKLLSPFNLAQANTQLKANQPLPIEKAEKIIETSTSSSTSTTTSENEIVENEETTSTQTTTEVSTTEETTTTRVSTSTTAESKKETTETPSTTTKEATTTEITPKSTTTNPHVIKVGADLEMSSSSPIEPLIIDGKLVRGVEDTTTVRPETNSAEAIESNLPEPLEDSLRRLQEESFFPEEESELTTVASSLLSVPSTFQFLAGEKLIPLSATDDAPDEPSFDVQSPIRSIKCLLRNGVICEHGCRSRIACVCKGPMTPEGACIHPGSPYCIPSTSVNATWDPVTMNIMVKSKQLAHTLRSISYGDRVYVEFGKAAYKGTEWNFDSSRKRKMSVGIDKILRSDLFYPEAFIFNVNETIDVDLDSFGMRVCMFNSSHVREAYDFNWESGDVVGQKKSNTMSLLLFNSKNSIREESAWFVLFNIGKIMLLLVLVMVMAALIYIFFTRVKAICERKRTHYFRPCYGDPQVQVHPASLYRSDPPLANYYDPRTH